MSQYESHHLEDRALPFIYKESISHALHRMPASANWHENVELLYIVKGEGTVWDNGHAIPVTSGDTVILNANHLHALAAQKEEMYYRYLIVDRAFCISNGIDTTALAFDPHPADLRIAERMEALDASYRLPQEDPFRIPQIRSEVLRLMLLLCRSHAHTAEKEEISEGSLSYVKEAIAYIRASYEKNFSLEDVAAFVGVNKFYLSREFHKYTGYRFVAYVNLTRCKMAQRLLIDPHLTVSEVGIRCGFENRSYFARSFRKYVGILPCEYRALGSAPLTDTSDHSQREKLELDP